MPTRIARLSTPSSVGLAKVSPVATVTGAALARQLAALGKRTLAAFRWPARALARSYGQGKWTGKQVLGHLTDTELVFLARLQFMLAEERPAVTWFDQDLWAARFRYENADVAEMRERFRVLRDAFVALTKPLSNADMGRRANHPEKADYDVRYLVTHAVEHNEKHLAQLDALKAGRTWTPPPA